MLTERMVHIRAIALEEARLRNYKELGAEHLLWGIVVEGGSIAAKVLASSEQGMRGLHRVRDALNKNMRPHQAVVTAVPVISQEAIDVFERASHYAQAWRDDYVGSEHVLYAISLCSRDSVAHKVFRDSGIDPYSIERTTAGILGEPAAPENPGQLELF